MPRHPHHYLRPRKPNMKIMITTAPTSQIRLFIKNSMQLVPEALWLQ